MIVLPNPISSAKIPPLHFWEELGKNRLTYPAKGLKYKFKPSLF